MHTNSIIKQLFIFLMQSMYAKMFLSYFFTLNVCFCNFISVSSYYMKQYQAKVCNRPTNALVW